LPTEDWGGVRVPTSHNKIVTGLGTPQLGNQQAPRLLSFRPLAQMPRKAREKCV